MVYQISLKTFFKARSWSKLTPKCNRASFLSRRVNLSFVIVDTQHPGVVGTYFPFKHWDSMCISQPYDSPSHHRYLCPANGKIPTGENLIHWTISHLLASSGPHATGTSHCKMQCMLHLWFTNNRFIQSLPSNF